MCEGVLVEPNGERGEGTSITCLVGGCVLLMFKLLLFAIVCL